MLQYLLCSRLAIWIGFLLDLLLGDPYSFPHPVRLMGRWIGWLDEHLRIKNETGDPTKEKTAERGERSQAEETAKRRERSRGEKTPKRKEWSQVEETAERKEQGQQEKTPNETGDVKREKERNQRWRGGLLVVLVLLPSAALPLFILALAYRAHLLLGMAVESIFCYQMLAARCLEVESKKVYTALKAGDLKGARYAVSMIVGRDTDRLDEQGITRAAVETVAENTSDGEIAPLFYMFLFGAVGGFFYKAANTMDSMIGYKNEKYRTFGTCAARLDDVLNFLPSRLAALLMIMYAFLEEKLEKNSQKIPYEEEEEGNSERFFSEGDSAEKESEGLAEKKSEASDFGRKEAGRVSGKNAFRIWRRDRLKHASPNSAQTESACAGALGVQLAGDAWYFGKPVKKETLGDADREIEYEDILRAHRLMYGTSVLMMVLGTAVSMIFLIY